MYGSHGKLLIVDLSKMDIIEKELEQEIFYEYLGGRGLGAYLLAKMLAPGEDPLSPQNVIIFASGPASDSGLAPASGYGIFTKSPVTGLFTEAYCRGYLPPLFKRTGYDAIAITGAASKPSFITISELGVNFYDAAETWGMETGVAENSILNAVGAIDSEVLSIGPAGEKMIGSACLKSNRYRSFGRAGIGAVFGSKKLKGIVFRGGAQADVFRDEEYAKWNEGFLSRFLIANKVLNHFNVPALITVANRKGCFTSGYWSGGCLEGWEGIVDAYRLKDRNVNGLSCQKCFRGCKEETAASEMKVSNKWVRALDYNAISAIGGLCRITDLDSIMRLVELCDRLGLDPVSAGNIASFAVEAGLKGKLNKAPAYGEPDSIAWFLELVAYGKDEGALFADGIRKAAEILNMSDFAVHIRGLEPAGFDPRVVKAAGLSHIVSGFGESNPENLYFPGISYGLFNLEKRDDLTRMFVEYEDKMNIIDSLIFCRNCHGLLRWEDLITAIYLLTGEHYSAVGLRAISARNLATIRLFNLNESTAGSDERMPPRMIKEPINNKKDLITLDELELMLKDYYLLRGWNENGIAPGGNLNHQLSRRTIQCL